MEDGWWYADGEQRHGPFNAGQFRALMRAGMVRADTLAWHGTWPAWQQVGDDPSLRAWLPPPIDSGADQEPSFDPDVPLDVPPMPPPHRRARSPQAEATLALPLATPSRRFFAQLIDLCWLLLAGGFLIGLCAALFWPRLLIWLEDPASAPLLGLVIVPIALVLQGLVLGLSGTTPGKLLLGVRLVTRQGERPDLMACVGRMMGLYWFGLGLGLPLIALFTMAAQYNRLKAGRPARYDEGRFQVHARPLGALRLVSGALVAAALLVLMVFSHQSAKEQEHRFLAGFEWTNPVTTLPASIPRGWTVHEQRNENGDAVYVFSSHRHGLTAVFAKEAVPDGMSLQQYVRLWSEAVSASMLLDATARPLRLGERNALTLAGTMADDHTRQAHVTLVRTGRQVWRLVAVAIGNQPADTAAVSQLREALFRSLAPESGPFPPAPAGQSI